VSDNGKGYIEDRRPASNMDPYLVSAIIADTSILPSERTQSKGMLDHFNLWSEWIEKTHIEKA